MAGKEIDIEELHSEILAAETYLKTAAKNEAAGDAARRSLDLRKSDILLQMGRKPLSAGSLTASMEAQAQNQAQAQASTRQSLDNDAGEGGTGGADRWSQYDDGDDEDEHHFQDAHNSPDSIDPRRRRSFEEEGSVGYIDPANRYSDPAEREELISRLLAEHRSSKQGDAAPSSSQRAHAGSSYRAYESRGSSESRYGADSDLDDDDEEGAVGSDVAELFYASDLVGDGAAASSAAGYSLYAGGEGVAAGGEEDPLESAATLRVRQAWGSKPAKRSGAWDSDPAQHSSSAPAGSSTTLGLRPQQPQPQKTRPELMKTTRPLRGASHSQARAASLESAGAGRRHKTREELVLEAEGMFNQQFSFTPSITAKAASARPSSVADRIAEMNEKHRRALLEREATRREGERAELRDCTFRPQLAKKTLEIIDKKARAESATRGGSSPPPAPKPPRPAASSAGAAGAGGRLATVGGNAPASGAGAGAGAGADFSSRLHNEARVREAQFRALQLRVQEARMAEFTFQPQLETSSTHASASAAAGAAPGPTKAEGAAVVRGNLEQRPIFERVAEEQRYRSKRLSDLRASYEEIQTQQLTFNPRIDPHSKAIAKQIVPESEANKPAGDRLFDEQKRQQKRQQQRLMQHERELSENSRQPLPCRGSELIVERRGIDKQPFDRRQESHQRLLQDKADTRRRQAEADAAAMFKPFIGKSEAIALASRPSLSSETEEERSYRLSTLDGADIAAHRAEIEKEVYKDLTFRPAIDPISKALGRRSSLDELVTNPKGKLVRQRAKEAQDRVVASECSFRPAVKDYVIDANAPSSSSSSSLVAGVGPGFGYYFESSVGGWEEGEGEAGEKENTNRSVNVTSAGVVRAKLTPREPERLSRDIRLHLQEKEERRRAGASPSPALFSLPPSLSLFLFLSLSPRPIHQTQTPAELIAREMESLRECSFAPSLPPPPPNSTDAGPVVVRGLGRHLELQHNAIKLKNDKNEREKHVFSVRGVEQLRRQEDGGTIVKPFSLSASSGKQSPAVVELMEVAEAQCTFAPVTTHLLRRGVIGRQARAVF